MNELSKSQIAVTFHYLADNLLTYFNKLDNGNASVSELFGIGEDGYLDDLYPYAEAIEAAWETRCKDRDAPGVWHYEVADNLAPKLFREMIKGDDGGYDEYPNIDDWKKNIGRVVDLWVDNKVKHDQPILPQLMDTQLRELTDILLRQRSAAVERVLETLQRKKAKGIRIQEIATLNRTEIIVNDKVYASVETMIVGTEAITTTSIKGLADE